jgi:BCD family chlorophyll transporter-like MFS transporter
MGLWGAAQAIAAAVGGLSGAIFVDILRATGVDVSHAFGIVFLFEASLFVYAALMARACVKQPAIQAALVAGE